MILKRIRSTRRDQCHVCGADIRINDPITFSAFGPKIRCADCTATAIRELDLREAGVRGEYLIAMT